MSSNLNWTLENGGVLEVHVIASSPCLLRFRVVEPGGCAEQVVPLKAIMDVWPLIAAALTLRGIKP